MSEILNFLQALLDLFFEHVTFLDVITIGFALYVISESFTAVCNMPSGWALFNHKLKFSLSFASGCVLIYYAFRNTNSEIEWLIFGFSANLAACMWQRMVWRYHKKMNELEICLNETHD